MLQCLKQNTNYHCCSLFRAVQVLVESKVHRLPVLEKSTGNISCILTHKRIMKFLSLYVSIR